MIDKVHDKLSLTDDVSIKSVSRIIKPIEVISQSPVDKETADFIEERRRIIENILSGKDKRVAVIVGPCSIHDPKAALDYAKMLKEKEKQFPNLVLIMRAYFEKPRTIGGWKGFTNDPDLDGSCNIEKGLSKGRELLLDINKIGLPVSTELLDVMTPQYFGDLFSYSAIGARTTESQEHRKMASGVGTPVGFKNGTNGSLKVALDAIESSAGKHNFLGITKKGEIAYVETKGNKNGHIILRGGDDGPNYEKENIDSTTKMLKQRGIDAGIVVDISHANSNKDYRNQPIVAESISKQIEEGNTMIRGIMIESNINEGCQKLEDPKNLEYGVSITDSCISFETTEKILKRLDKAVETRNQKLNK